MGFSLRIADAVFTKYIAVKIPYLELASAFYLFGGDAAASIKNYANKAAPAAVIGAPAYSPGYASLSSGANGFDSGITGKSPFTHIAVVTPLSAYGGYCGNWIGPAQTKNLLFREQVGEPLQLDIAVDGMFRAFIPFSGAAFQLIAASHDGSTAKVYAHDGAILNSAAGAYAGGVTSAPFRVGASVYGVGTFNCAAAMTFASVLSAAQITEIYAYLKTTLALRGVVLT